MNNKRILEANYNVFNNIVDEIAGIANRDIEDVIDALYAEMYGDEIIGSILTTDNNNDDDDIKIVNGEYNKIFKIFSRFSFMVEYKDRVLERLNN